MNLFKAAELSALSLLGTAAVAASSTVSTISKNTYVLTGDKHALSIAVETAKVTRDFKELTESINSELKGMVK